MTEPKLQWNLSRQGSMFGYSETVAYSKEFILHAWDNGYWCIINTKKPKSKPRKGLLATYHPDVLTTTQAHVENVLDRVHHRQTVRLEKQLKKDE